MGQLCLWHLLILSHISCLLLLLRISFFLGTLVNTISAVLYFRMYHDTRCNLGKLVMTLVLTADPETDPTAAL